MRRPRLKLSMYVATSKPDVYANRILSHFELQRYFSHVFGAELDGARSDKAELLAYALSITEEAETSRMIGDRSHDMIGARANGMHPIGVSYGYGTTEELRSAGASQIVDQPSELTLVLEGEP